MYGLIRPFREDTPYYRNVEQILKSNGMKHLKINKNLYICIVKLRKECNLLEMSVG